MRIVARVAEDNGIPKGSITIEEENAISEIL